MKNKLLYILLFSMAYGIEIKQLDCEHPKLAFIDSEFFSNVSMKSSRLNRSDNTHYFDFNATILKPLDKDITVTVLLQQQNNILPTANLLELHYRLCDLVSENNIIVKQIKDAFYRIPKDDRPMPNFKCPFKTGKYSFTKMGMPSFLLPNNFPAMDGRITSAMLYKNRVIIKIYGRRGLYTFIIKGQCIFCPRGTLTRLNSYFYEKKQDVDNYYYLNSVLVYYMGAETAKVGSAAPPPECERALDERVMYCIVGGAHAFILRISSFFGLAPLRFESRGHGFTVGMSKAMCIYSYILVTVLVICTVFGLVAEINVGVGLSVRMSSTMSQFVSACDVLVVVVTAGAGVYGAPKRMRNMLKFMESVASVDTSIGAHYSVVAERKLCAVLLAILIFFSVLIADDFCFYARQAIKFNRQWDVVINYIGFYLLWYVVMILELQFAFTALSVRARFQAVNDALALTARHVSVPVEKVKELSPMNMFAIQVGERRDQPQLHSVIVRNAVSGEPKLIVPPCEAIRRLACLHGSLCNVVHRIDSSYGLPLIVILISTLLHLIVTPYFLIMEIIVSAHRIHFLVLQFLWCATHLIRMFVVVEPCHYTITEGKRTEELVCQLMTSTHSTGILPSRLELFSRQLMLQSISYTPMGMCTLDRPLVASVLGAVTTYLVILIQFQRYDS